MRTWCVTLNAVLALLALPLASALRTYRLTAEVAALRERIEALERALANSRSAAAAPPPPAVRATPEQAAAAPVAEAVPPAVAVQPSPGPALPPLLEPIAPPLPAADWVPAGAAESRGDVAAAAAIQAEEPEDLESRIGGRWLLYVGVSILLLGLSFFLKYAFDNAWLTETGRVVFGALIGLGLVAGGWRTAARLRIFGLALVGTGLGTLYLSVYAALAFYFLIQPWTAFALMLATTVLGTVLADRGRAESTAVIAAAGGYVTPFLVSGTSHDTTLLLGYFLLLSLGVLALTRRHRWLALPCVGYLLTVVAIAAWAGASYASREWLRVLFFLTMCALVFIGVLHYVRRQDGRGVRAAAQLLWTGPVLYHLAAIAITSGHPPALHIYLIVFTVIGILLTIEAETRWLRVIVLLATYVPLFGAPDAGPGASALTTSVVTAAAIAVLHVMALVDRVTRQEIPLVRSDCLVLHLAVIGLFGLLVQALEPRFPEWRGGAGAILALAAAGLWFFFESRDRLGSLNAAGLSFTMVALAIAVQFESRVAVIGWAVEGAVAAWIGVKSGLREFRYGGLGLVALAAVGLMDGYTSGGPALVPIANDRSLATIVVVALAYLVAWLWRRIPDLSGVESHVPVALYGGAAAFTMIWLSVEIEDYWRRGPASVQAALFEQLMRSLAWGVYGALSIVVGRWREIVALRWIGFGVIGITVLKVFLVDLSTLGGIYRVIGFLVVGVLLVGISYLYQQSRSHQPRVRTDEEPDLPASAGTSGPSEPTPVQ